MDKIRRKFLWQGNSERKGYNLVKWDAVIVGKKHGGLEIKNLLNQSKALMMKWLWKFNNGEQAYWKEVIRAKYVEEDNWMTKEVTTAYGVSVWRSIGSLWSKFKANTQIKLRNGENRILERCAA